MPEKRFYLPIIGSTLQGEELKHLQVMRPRIHDKIEICDGQGTLAQAEIQSIDKKSANLLILETTHEKAPSFELILAQALPRSSRLDTILEKGTELGMTTLILFESDNSEKKGINQERIEKVIIAAMKQSGRLWKPKVEVWDPISKWKKQTLPLLFGDLRNTAPSLLTYWQKHPPKEGVIFVVGPEKGLTDQEIKTLEHLGGTGVRLHHNTLRTDTAPLAALSIMSHLVYL